MNATLFLSCLAVYLLLMIGFGWWITRHHRSGDDFLLGGRALPYLLTLGTTVATMVGTGSSMGAVGKAYRDGWAGALYGIGGTLGILLLAWWFAPVRQHRFLTMGEELASYVGAHRLVKNLVSIFIYLACVGWLGAHILGGGNYLQFVTGIDPFWAKLWIALGFGIYAVIGGYTAVVWTDSLQAIVLFVGFMATAFFSYRLIGGWSELQATSSGLWEGRGGAFPLPSISLVVVIAVGVLGTPAFRQRIYSGSSVFAIRKAFVTSGVLYLGFASLPAIIGMTAYATQPGLAQGDLAFPYMATEVLPTSIGVLILLAGLSATMSSASSDAIAAVTTLLRDLSSALLGRVPAADRVVTWSRWGLVLTTGLAFAMAMIANNVIGYISQMISLFITGMCVLGVCGRLWPRYNAVGALATLATAFLTALTINAVPAWTAWWGNPVIPSLLLSALAGVVASLLTPPDRLSHAEALCLLQAEREQMEEAPEPPVRRTADER